MTDFDLLREYLTQGAEDAFTTIVERYTRLVYSAALRQSGNVHEAEDISQAVFIILARKAGSLPRDIILAGWLLRTTRFVALNARRRHWHHQQLEADMLSEIPTETEAAWERMSPLLDEAMERLGKKDLTAVALRYFEQRSFKQIAETMGTTEDGAQKRVTRAVEKMRHYFGQRGLVLSSMTIGLAISARGVEAAPAYLATTVMADVRAGAVLTGGVSVLVKVALAAGKAARLQTIGLWALATIVILPLVANFVTHQVRIAFLPNLPWQTLVASAEGNTLVATVSGVGSIYVSQNSGATWRKTSAPEGFWDALATSADGTKLLAAGSDYLPVTNGLINSRAAGSAWIFTSTNSGTTWTRSTGTPTNVWWTCAASSADGSKLVVAAGLGGIYISTNAGMTWKPSTAPSKQWHSIACSTDGNRMAALAATGGAYTWDMAAKGRHYTADEMGFSTADETNLVSVAINGGIYTSTDRGATWSRTTASNSLLWWSVAVSSDGSKLVAATTAAATNANRAQQNPDGTTSFSSSMQLTGGGSLYVSTNAGADWNLTGAPTNRWASVATSSDGTTIAAAGADTISISHDSGASWATTRTPGASWTSVTTSANGKESFAANKGFRIQVVKP